MNRSALTDDLRFLELLAKWSHGDFTRRDEQELTALAMADDFRREAWEGFRNLPEEDHERRLAALRTLLGGAPARRIPLGILLAAAASVVLLLGVIWFFPGQKQAAEQAPMATAPAIEQTADTTEPQAIADNGASAPGGSVSYWGKGAPKTPVTGNAGPSAAASRPEEQDIAFQDASEEAKTTAAAPPPAAPEPFATQPAVTKDDLAKEDRQASKPNEPAKKEGEPAGEDNVMSEVIVRATPQNSYGAPGTRAKESGKKAKDAYRKEDQAEPVAGWAELNKYFRANARLTPEALKNGVSGSVKLQFDVDDNGKPVNISVKKELGFGCNEIAIDLLENTLWRRKTVNKNLFIDIPFEK